MTERGDCEEMAICIAAKISNEPNRPRRSFVGGGFGAFSGKKPTIEGGRIFSLAMQDVRIGSSSVIHAFGVDGLGMSYGNCGGKVEVKVLGNPPPMWSWVP